MIIEHLPPSDPDLIKQIADWYFHEWGISTDTTIQRLTNRSNDDVIFQLVVKKDSQTVATGGLYNAVGLLKAYPRFAVFKPWVALLYTDTKNRNQGVGRVLLKQIEEDAKALGYTKIYLFTFTAESLYKRMGWTQVERVDYKGNDTVVMQKEL